MEENRAEVARLLGETLKATSRFRYIVSCEFKTGEEAYPYTEAVLIKFENGKDRLINVSMDSGFALIKDVVRWLNEGIGLDEDI